MRLAGGGDGGDGVALVEHLLARDDVAQDVAVVDQHLARRDELGGLVLEVVPVTMALTPGRASALVVSMDTMRAWACGERSTAPSNMPASVRSAPKRARPVTLSTPSGRMGRVPTTSGTVVALGIVGDGPACDQASLISAAASMTARTILS